MNYLRRLINFIHSSTVNHNRTKKEIDELKLLVAKTLIANQKNHRTIRESEFKVFSQWGDDGIIQFLIHNINISNNYFIEFGVENYTEANTRFLLMNNNWSGLIMDGSLANIDYIKKSDIYWKYDLCAKHAFVNAENINDLLRSENTPPQIGILHIDIDGNDYWIWKKIDFVKADIVIVEYNSLFGSQRAITIPYKSDFVRSEAHYSHLYYGSSLQSLCDLAAEKGYAFVGCNLAGNNAYFVLNEKMGNLTPISVEAGFVMSKFKEARNEEGHLTFSRGMEREVQIKNTDVYNTRTNQLEKF